MADRSFAEVALLSAELKRFWRRLGAAAPEFQVAVANVAASWQPRPRRSRFIDDEAVTFNTGRVVFDMAVPTVRMFGLAIATTLFHLEDQGAGTLAFLGCALIEVVEGRAGVGFVRYVADAIADGHLFVSGVPRK